MSVMKICQALFDDFGLETWNKLVKIFVSTESPLLRAVNQTDPATGDVNLKAENSLFTLYSEQLIL